MALSKITNASLTDSTLTGAKIASSTITGTNILASTLPNLGRRNLVINGGMDIDQRNAGAGVTPASGNYTLDRFQVFSSASSKYSVQKNAGSVTPPLGFTNYLGVTSLAATSVAAGDYYMVEHKIEGFNISGLAWGTVNAKAVTLSFQVYSSLTGTFGGSVLNSASNRSYPFTYSVASANTWTTVAVTIPGDTSGTWLTNNGTGLYISFSLGMGSTYSGTAGLWAGVQYWSATGAVSVVGTSGATFYITGVQLEANSAATPFEHRSYGEELSACQRYYQRKSNGYLAGNGSGSNQISFGVPLPTSMRATPSTPPTFSMHRSGNSWATVSINQLTFSADADHSLLQLRAAGISASDEVAYNVHLNGILELDSEL